MNQNTGLVVRRYDCPHAEAVGRLRSALEAHSATLFALIDHAANATSVGLAMPPTAVLIFGNPAVGTDIMLARPDIAFDLPSRVLIREVAHGGTEVVWADPAALCARYDLAPERGTGLSNLARIIETAFG